MARRAPSRLALALCALALPLLLAACSEAKPATPSPEVIETAESGSRPVTIQSTYSTTPEKGDEDKEPIVLSGRLFGSGPTGVILAHMRPADQTAWFPYATQLAQTGRYTVLTFDFRGYNDSTGDKQFDRVDTDLTAAYEYMRDALGFRKIFLVGASMGGTASIVVGTRVPVAGVVSISSPGVFPPLDAVEAVKDLTVPKLFITSKDDVPQEKSQEEFWAAAPDPKEQEVYDGDAHGTDLFQSPHADEVSARVTAFLDAH
ncbi:MAG TPA: alpha/beta hydrolase [Dehalococcoidia bacterium]|jgi:alpha-beta hydrolase superfamily lysophospholipase|nr:alpha/beta hydrolase [Dehalococcoidia bacterium]